MFDHLSRREFSLALASAAGVAPWFLARPVSGKDVTRTSEAIRQEITLNANPARVYTALTDAAQFTKLVAFSSVKNAPPAQIDPNVGGTFSLFAGHIIGRHLELVPSQRIVQAWRVVDWPDGIYSIARFEITQRSGKSVLVFDHTGFPNGLGEHLAEGWRTNYWEPLRKYLLSS